MNNLDPIGQWLEVFKLGTTILNEPWFVCLFDTLRPINNLSVKQGRIFLG